MFYLVSYDIPDDKRRTKLSKTLKDFGDRVHLSVFECIMTDDLLHDMKNRINSIINQKEDSVRIYTLCANCEKIVAIIGSGELTQDKDVYII
ncbi:MAG: CRISPR-associated endonuclease Cas2 [Deltaproteobacteria bacterium]|nr:CRISPR-associated endonuclease Cas2 [Deltaproteobacteria bacterium]